MKHKNPYCKSLGYFMVVVRSLWRRRKDAPDLYSLICCLARWHDNLPHEADLEAAGQEINRRPELLTTILSLNHVELENTFPCPKFLNGCPYSRKNICTTTNCVEKGPA